MPSSLQVSKDQPNPLERSQPIQNQTFGCVFLSRPSTGNSRTIIEVKVDAMNGVVDLFSIGREYHCTYNIPENPDNWFSSKVYYSYNQKIRGSQIVSHKRMIFRRRQ